VRYISTRGEAPPLGFVEATLAGLARDGGLYVPAAWPQLDTDAKWQSRLSVLSSVTPLRSTTSPA
jgi:threonine synthase